VFKIKIHNSNSKDEYFKVNGYLRDANKRDEKMNIGLEKTIFVLANKDEFVEISVYKSWFIVIMRTYRYICKKNLISNEYKFA